MAALPPPPPIDTALAISTLRKRAPSESADMLGLSERKHMVQPTQPSSERCYRQETASLQPTPRQHPNEQPTRHAALAAIPARQGTPIPSEAPPDAPRMQHISRGQQAQSTGQTAPRNSRNPPRQRDAPARRNFSYTHSARRGAPPPAHGPRLSRARIATHRKTLVSNAAARERTHAQHTRGST